MIEAGHSSEQAGAIQADMMTAGSLPYSSGQVEAEIHRARRKRLVTGVAVACGSLVLVAVLVVLIVLALTGSFVSTQDDSMLPSIGRGEVVVLDQARHPSDNDVVLCQPQGGTMQLRRVVASAGEWVTVASDGSFVVGLAPLTNETVKQFAGPDTDLLDCQQVREGYYFVLPDSVMGGADTLSSEANFATESQIKGVAVIRIWPLAKFGSTL